MIAIFFEWRIEEPKEEAFRAAWAEVTRALRAHGSLGSTLFRKSAGHYCALARWPDEATCQAASDAEKDSPASKRLHDAIGATLQKIQLDEIDNLWVDRPA